MGKKAKNPFNLRMDGLPAHRAGHDEVADCLKERLEDIRAGHGGNVVVLYGPRGTGKSSLLEELCARAQETGVRAVNIEFGTSPGDPARLVRRLGSGRKLGLGGIKRLVRGMFGRSEGVVSGDSPETQLEAALREALGESPLALAIDEAHTLPPRFGCLLLQVAQDCLTDELPLLLVLAGTPALPSALRKTGAGFWERFPRFQIGLLESDAATREAFAVPAESAGCPVDEDALGLLVRASQRYPLFVQQLGWNAWEAAAKRAGEGDGPRRITVRDAEKGIAASEATIGYFYLDRRDDLDRHCVLGEAVAVSDAMMTVGGGKALSGPALAGALRTVASDEDSLLAARKKLSHLGLIWQRPEGHWEPGIPSLCERIASRGREE